MIKTILIQLKWLVITLGIGLLITVILIPSFEELLGYSSGTTYGWILWGICLLPLVCLLIYNIFIIINRNWTHKKIVAIIIINLILLFWLSNSIKAIYQHDLSTLWIFYL